MPRTHYHTHNTHNLLTSSQAFKNSVSQRTQNAVACGLAGLGLLTAAGLGLVISNSRLQAGDAEAVFEAEAPGPQIQNVSVGTRAPEAYASAPAFTLGRTVADMADTLQGVERGWVHMQVPEALAYGHSVIAELSSQSPLTNIEREYAAEALQRLLVPRSEIWKHVDDWVAGEAGQEADEAMLDAFGKYLEELNAPKEKKKWIFPPLKYPVETYYNVEIG